MLLLVSKVVRMTVGEAARRQGVSVEQIRFVSARCWLATADPGDSLPDLVVNRLCSHRIERRVGTRRPKEYAPLTSSRAVLRQLLAAQAVAEPLDAMGS